MNVFWRFAWLISLQLLFPIYIYQTKTQRLLHIKTKIENSKDIDDSEQVYYYLIKTLILRHINFEVSITIHENIWLCHKNTYKIKILMKHFER